MEPPRRADGRRQSQPLRGPRRWCGLGAKRRSSRSLQALVAECPLPTVLDGDALRLLGDQPTLGPNHVVTPHDGEFEALAGYKVPPDRFEAARDLARRLGATVVLKGPLTIVAEPGGRCLAANRGDQRLATAGTGDVLAGIIGSFLAAGLDPLSAGALAAWVHGDSGLDQVRFGMVASDLFAGLGSTFDRLAAYDRHPNPHGGPHASN